MCIQVPCVYLLYAASTVTIRNTTYSSAGNIYLLLHKPSPCYLPIFFLDSFYQRWSTPYAEHCIKIWEFSFKLAEYIKPKIQRRHFFADMRTSLILTFFLVSCELFWGSFTKFFLKAGNFWCKKKGSLSGKAASGTWADMASRLELRLASPTSRLISWSKHWKVNNKQLISYVSTGKAWTLFGLPPEVTVLL